MAVIHEFGHAMGYWHSDVVPSVMGGGPVLNCHPINLSPDENKIARTMYARPRGNIEPDRDPDGTVLLSVPAASRPVMCERILRR